MSSKRIKVAVTSVGSGIGQSVVDGCRRSSLDIELIGLDMNPFSFGALACDHYATLPPVKHPEYLQCLLDECIAKGADVLIPGLDSELLVLAENRRLFESRGVRVVVAGPELIGLCRDKLKWGRTLSPTSSIVVPCLSAVEAMDKLRTGELSPPLIAKPLAGSASAGIHIIHRAEQLLAIGSDYVVQPFALPLTTDPHYEEIRNALEKGRILQVAEISIQSLYGQGGRLLGRMASYNRLKDGIPIEVVPVSLGADEAAVSDLEAQLMPLGLRGPVNLQGRRTDKGLNLFEMNARFTGITGLRSKLGFNEVEASIRDSMGLPAAESCLATNFRKVGVRQVKDQVTDPARSIHLAKLVKGRGHLPSQGQNVLVTGASGWLAARLVQRLVDDSRVASLTLLSRNPEQLQSGLPQTSKPISIVPLTSSSERPALPAGKIDLVYHLASGRPVDSLESQADGLKATATLLEHLAQNGLGSLVNVSSQSVYGLKRPTPWKESLSAAPETPYAMMKWASELLTQSVGKTSPGCRVTSLRLARLYGAAPGLRWSELPHLFAQKAAAGSPITIKGGKQQFDLIHIRDAVDAMLAFLDDQRGWQDVYNLGSNDSYGIVDIAKAAVNSARALGLAEGEIKLEEGAENTQFGMDCGRFLRDFGWKPAVGLNEAMLELVQLARQSTEQAGK